MSGATTVHTKMGGFLSFIMFILVMIYASLKLIQLQDRNNPNISQFLEENIYDHTEKLDLNEAQFRIAFSVEGFHDREMKDDHRYVKYLVRLYGHLDFQKVEYALPFHKCTESDWALFPPASRDSLGAWTDIKDDPKRNMFCIDWDGDRNIFGNYRNPDFRGIDIVFAPCNYWHHLEGDFEDTVHPDCVWDQDE